MSDIPSLSSGSVGSRFVSQNEIDSANANRDAAWKAAYARLGQEPPPRPVEDVYDGRSLFEKLQEQKTKKQEEWDQKMKLGNQFRGIDEEETAFLSSVQDERLEEERIRKLRDAEEVRLFKEAASNRAELPIPSSSTKVASVSAPVKPPAAKPALGKKKDQKSLLKGLVVKKKDKGKASSSASTALPATSKKEDGESKTTKPADSSSKDDTNSESPVSGKRSAQSLDDDNIESKKQKLLD